MLQLVDRLHKEGTHRYRYQLALLPMSTVSDKKPILPFAQSAEQLVNLRAGRLIALAFALDIQERRFNPQLVAMRDHIDPAIA